MYEAEIQRGAAFLDEVVPNWMDIIDVDTLELSSPCKCICGQLGKHLLLIPCLPVISWSTINYYIPFLNEFSPADLPREDNSVPDELFEWSINHGFSLNDWTDFEGFSDLTQEWKHYIESRKNPQSR